jgi:FAD/FMN-containing dehydrogenase
VEINRRSIKTKVYKNDEVDTEPKSKITQAIKLFLEGKTPVEVVIALDLPADQVRAIYREFWELKEMHRLAQIYEEAKYDLHSLLRLHKIVIKDNSFLPHKIFAASEGTLGMVTSARLKIIDIPVYRHCLPGVLNILVLIIILHL